MDRERLRMLERVQALEFTAVDLNLYLDTHPTDHRALTEYNHVSRQLASAREEYERLYGPLVHFGFSASPSAWRWIEDPWPWEIVYDTR